LALRRPFEGDTAAEVFRRIESEEPPPLLRLRSNVDRDLAVLCEKAIAKDPAARFSTADEFADELDRRLRGEPIVTKSRSVVRRLRAFYRRRRFVVLATLVGVVALAAGLALRPSPRAPRTHVRITVSEYKGANPVAGELSYRRIEPVTGKPLERIALGPSPI